MYMHEALYDCTIFYEYSKAQNRAGLQCNVTCIAMCVSGAGPGLCPLSPGPIHQVLHPNTSAPPKFHFYTLTLENSGHSTHFLEILTFQGGFKH